MSISIVRGTQLSALFLFGLVTGQAGAAEGATVTVESMPAKDVAVESTAAEAVAVQSTTAKSATYGLGASGVFFNGGVIYFPIRTAFMILEPHISYSHSENKTSGTGDSVQSYPPNVTPPNRTTTVASQSTFTNGRQEIGLGTFGKNQITDEIEFYYGGRFGYLADEQSRKTRRDTVDLTDGYTETRTDKDSRALTGYFLAPTFGLQYFPRPNFSLGIEVAFRYENLSGNDDSSYSDTTNDPSGSTYVSNETRNADSVNYRTVASTIIRGYF